jgi:hypothetical protein
MSIHIIDTSIRLHRHINASTSTSLRFTSLLKLCKKSPRFLHGLSYDDPCPRIKSKVLRLMEESRTAGSLISVTSDILDLLSSVGSRISLINRVTTAVETQPNLEIPLVFVPPDGKRLFRSCSFCFCTWFPPCISSRFVGPIDCHLL